MQRDHTLNQSKMEIETVTTAPQINKRGPKAKHWAGCTLNNYVAVDEAKFEVSIQPIADYYVYGKETGKEGTRHLQFMICFKSAKELSALKKIFPTAHFEMKSPLSTMTRASNYCKKGIFINLFIIICLSYDINL